MFARIAPLSDSDEVREAEADCKDTRIKISEKHADTISYKIGQKPRRIFKIRDEGKGVLQKDGELDIPCYYFVVQYTHEFNHNFASYAGGTIVDEKGKKIKLDKNNKTIGNKRNRLPGN